MSPGETVAIVREAVAEEAKKWRCIQASQCIREKTLYNVWRAGHAVDEYPPFLEGGEVIPATSFICHQGVTKQAAEKIIADASWAAAVDALVKAQTEKLEKMKRALGIKQTMGLT